MVWYGMVWLNKQYPTNIIQYLSNNGAFYDINDILFDKSLINSSLINQYD